MEPDIRDKEKALYKEMSDFFMLNGRMSYLDNGFLKAALPISFEFWMQSSFIANNNLNSELVLLNELKDNQIRTVFSINNIKGLLPFSQNCDHVYRIRKINGTSSEATKKIISGRKAEKYFISFLNSLGFLEKKDYIDVANNKNFGYDLRFLEMGFEIKNIKHGGFYLTDNEIARLENTETYLILVDIDNGIWGLSNKSLWLQDAIRGIKEIRKYCKINYTKLDLSDIRINIDENIKKDILEISKYSKNEIASLFSS